MLQSVPAQVVSQVHVASLLHTCTDQTMTDAHDFEKLLFLKRRLKTLFSLVLTDFFCTLISILF